MMGLARGGYAENEDGSKNDVARCGTSSCYNRVLDIPLVSVISAGFLLAILGQILRRSSFVRVRLKVGLGVAMGTGEQQACQ